MMPGSKSSSLRAVWNAGQFTDLTLNCGDESFEVNKAIVCMQSPVMAAALMGEVSPSEIDISLDLPCAKRLIDFMYTGDYQLSSYTASHVLSLSSGVLSTWYEEEKGSTTEGLGGEIVLANTGADSAANTPDHEQSIPVYEQLISHSRMNDVAHYYNIPALEILASEKTRRIFERNWSAKTFCDFLREISGSTADGEFHRMLATIAIEHVDEISKSGLLDDTDVARDLSPYMLSKCCSMLLETRSPLKTAT